MRASDTAAPAPLRLAINGASGRMGRELFELARGDRRFALKRAVVGAGSEAVGRPLCMPATSDSLRHAAGWEDAAVDVVVDFSSPRGLASALDYCESHMVALVTGTTGLDGGLDKRLQAAAGRIPVLRAANFSLGVALLTRLLREAAAALPDWDLEIIEAHHVHKQDAPSGTALALGEAAAAARGATLADVAVPARQGATGARTTGSIGFAVLRGGDIVGEHTAMLAARGERLELTHRASDRAIFARGALHAAAWLAARPPGSYGIEDLLQVDPPAT